MKNKSGSIKDKQAHFHSLSPNYERFSYSLPLTAKTEINAYLQQLYPPAKAKKVSKELERLLSVYYAHKSEQMIEWEKSFSAKDRFSEKDVVLITYGDLICDKQIPRLKTLLQISKKYFSNVFNTIHLLPFFPYSSDRGFSVIDFKQVDPNLGTWEDILEFKDDFCLMFDGVFNHISSKSAWFQEFLNQNPFFDDFFISYTEKTKLSQKNLKKVFRPRTSALLTPFQTLKGKRFVWTTFGPDQVDLKFQNPDVLLSIIEILLFYVRQGADLIRLDAVTYLWYEIGSNGIHLPQTHLIIKLFRSILNAVAPHVALVTETNVPHKDNISYFGNGYDEAQLVYNFALPPLVLYMFLFNDSGLFNQWASTLELISDTANYFNFLDSHDGIGVMGARGILSEEQIEQMSKKVLEHGGRLSYKQNTDGSKSVYEMNITFFSALNKEQANQTTDKQIDRYIAARAVALVFIGVPGIYFHGLLGSKNDIEAMERGEENRNINRRNLDKEELVACLENPLSITYKITKRLCFMIQKRTAEKSFHPSARQKVLSVSNKCVSLLRIAQDHKEVILAVVNVTNQDQSICFDLKKESIVQFGDWFDVLTEQLFALEKGKLPLVLRPYQVLWLKGFAKE